MTTDETPWWQLSATPLRGYLRGAVLLTISCLTWVPFATGDDVGALRLVLGSALAIFGVAALASATALLAHGHR